MKYKPMHEILFRGKRTENHQWVDGYYICDNNKENPNPYIVNAKGKYRVSHKTIGQYTGMKDKNGKRIFEGDIVKAEDMNDPCFIGKIEYQYFAWNVIGENWAVSLFVANSFHRLVVIGNIHENPELIFPAGGVT